MKILQEDSKMYGENSKIDDQTIVHIEAIALPFERIIAHCWVEEKTPLPLIKEYILRAIKIGINRTEGISSILGLSEDVINEYSAMMIADRHLTISTSDESYIITKTGLELMGEYSQIVSSEKTYKVLKSCLTGNIFHVKDLQVENKPQDRRLIHIPSTVQSQHEIDPILLQNIFSKDNNLRVLKASISGKVITYVLARLFIFQEHHSDQLIFKIDFEATGKSYNPNRDEECKLIVNRLQEIGDLQVYTEEISKTGLEEPVSDQHREIYKLSKIHEDKVNELNKTIQKNENIQEEIKNITLSKQHEINDSEASQQEQEARELKIKSLTEENESLKNQLTNLPKQIKTFEHPAYLDRALLRSVKRLLIISPWIKPGGLSRSRLQKLEELLKKKVEIYIGYGIREDANDCDPKIINALTGFKKKYKDYFHFEHLGQVHSKVLASDDKFYIVTSFNWMSYHGGKNKDGSYKYETGIVLSDPEQVNKHTTDAINELFSRFFTPP